MPYVSLLDAFCDLLDCQLNELQEKLNHPNCILVANEFLEGKTLRTNYLNKKNEYTPIKNAKIGYKSARDEYAYEGFFKILFSY